MDIKVADSFWKSLDKIERHGTWWYKTYSFLRYQLPNFIKNIWKFRKELWEYTWWDYQFMLMFMRKCTHDMAVNFERKGWEIEETKKKKVDKMLRAAIIMDNFIESKHLELAEKQLGLEYNSDWDIDEDGMLSFKDTPEQKKNNRKISLLSDKLQEQEWNELWEIFRGQDHKQYVKARKKENIHWNDWFDGSGARHWWD